MVPPGSHLRALTKQQTLNDESFKAAALQAEDIPALIEKIRQIKLVQVHPPLTTKKAVDETPVLDETQQDGVGGDGSVGGDSVIDDVNVSISPPGHCDPQDTTPRGEQEEILCDTRIDTLLSHLDDIIYTLTEVTSLRARAGRVETKVTDLKKDFDSMRNDIDANTLFTITHKDKIEGLDVDALILRVTELEEKVQSLPKSQETRTGTLQGPTGTIKAPHLSRVQGF